MASTNHQVLLQRRQTQAIGSLKSRRPLSRNAEHPHFQDARPGAEALEDIDKKSLVGDTNSWKDERWLWGVCLTFRLVNALFVRTYFNPDEHWQTLEVAHRIAFGYGHLTWEWKRGIRSYVHPLIFAAFYKLLALMRLDTPWFMARAPRLLQAIFAAGGDVYLYKLSLRVFGQRTAYWALFCHMVNWFTFFCMVRTLSNSLETTLTIVALFYLPNKMDSRIRQDNSWLSSRKLALAIAALSCAVRPTNAIIWLYMGTLQLFETRGKFQFLLAEVFPIGICCLILTTFVDRWMYGNWVLVPLNFLKFNVLSSGGDFYGTHPWHWYFSQGFSVMVFTFLPISVAGMWWSKNRVYTGLICWVLTIYSILGHKEFRFVLPVLPLSMMFAGYGLTVLEQWREPDQFVSTEGPSDSSSTTSVQKPSKTGGLTRQQWSFRFWCIIVGLLLTNVPTALYTSMIHQRGGEAVIEYLAEEAYHGRVESVLFLMPCHSTPFYSSIHSNLPMRFLDCSPSYEAGYVHEADRFDANPIEFLYTMFEDGEKEVETSLPSHIVLYDSIHLQVQLFLEKHSYNLVKMFFHAHFPVDRELQGHVLVFALS